MNNIYMKGMRKRFHNTMLKYNCYTICISIISLFIFNIQFISFPLFFFHINIIYSIEYYLTYYEEEYTLAVSESICNQESIILIFILLYGGNAKTLSR